MQLKRETKRSGALVTSLAAATCSLLGTLPGRTLAQEEPPRWSYDAALLYYEEQQERVSDLSGSLLIERRLRANRLLSLNLSVDTLTGASPSGAVAANRPQTFTSPSGGEGSYTTPAGKIPLDPTFLDTRVSVGADFSQELGHSSRLTYGLSLSDEYDYFHAGARATLSRDFRDHNTTLDLGIAFADDSIDPVGGVPRPFAVMMPGKESDKESDDDLGEGSVGRLGGDSKTVLDLLVGVTQVLGPRTLAQVNYSLSRSAGYLTDPYKLLSVVDPGTGDPVRGAGDLSLVLYESRPDSRTQHALFLRLKRQVRDDGVADASYRFVTDDWGVTSHTLDLRYRFGLGRSYLQPHLRYYLQSAADFYAPYLLDGRPVPDYASADSRLGEFDGITFGLKYGLPVGDAREWSARVEYYTQSGRSPPGAAFGSLSQLELVPSLDALIVQVGYRF